MFHKRKTYLYYLLLSTLVSVWACRKDVEEFRPYTPTQEDLSQLFTQVPGASSHTIFNFGGSIPDTTLTTASGVRVFLADTEHLFADDAGTPVPCSTCPSLKIEVTTVLKKGEIVSLGLPTITFPDPMMLESAGLVKLRVTCAGKLLQLLPGRYFKVQIPDNAPKAGMEVFTEKYDQNAQLAGWTATGSEAFFADWPQPNNPGLVQTGYELIVQQMGWINCAQEIIEQNSPFCVTLPDQFTALNARVFLVFKNIRAVAELTGNDADSKFCFPAAPLGYPVTIVVIGKTGGQYWLAQKFTEIGSNVEMQISPQPLDEKELLGFLQSL